MNPFCLKDLRCFFLDMDGTIYMGRRLIPGADGFIAYLKDSGRRFLFFTNNPASDAARYSEKLAGMGILAGPEDILTSGEATARYLVAETSYRRVFALGTPSFEGNSGAQGLN